MIQEYANILDEDTFNEAIKETVLSDRWSFSQNSQTIKGQPDFTFWKIDLSTSELFNGKVADRIKKLIGHDFTIDRLYANGQTFGLPGSIHTDVNVTKESNMDLYKTFIMYTHPLWRLDWGGTTIIMEEDKQTHIIPKPNHGVLFNSVLPHIGMEPTRHCTELRVSVAYKIKIKP